MKPPPLILGMALLFWGWRTNMLWIGVLAGGLLELSHVVRGRWSFTDKEFNRLWDVCTVLLVAAMAYLRFSEDISSAGYKFFEWMPLIFYPMVLGYTFSEREMVPMKAFSWLLRRKGAQGGDRGVAFGWLYIVVCLVAAGATNAQDIWFFVGSSVLIGWALWANRPQRMALAAWCVLFLVIAGAAFYGQSRMLEIQAYFENKISEMIVKFGGRRDFDPNQSQTAMGRIGSLKQSSAVVMKVKPVSGPVPERLLECLYSRLDGNVWKSGGGGRGSFDSVAVESDATTWTFAHSGRARGAVRIIQKVNRKSALLAVPFGTKQLRELTAGSVETNRTGVVRVKDSPGLLNFVARFGPVSEEFTERRRMSVEESERAAIQAVARELNIDNLPDEEKARALVRFFQEKFRYTTYQHARELGLHDRTPLSIFLLNTRAGHCEYFASATVLLLRHYDIPARYATGYAVQELAKEDDSYIIRERHGHAWAVAYINGNWVEVDTTPAGWAEAEAEEFPAYEDLTDAWARFTFGFLEWRWLGDWGFFRIAAPWLVIPLTVFLVWRIFGRRMARAETPIREGQIWPGADSEFFALERKLAKNGLSRHNEETTENWLHRIRNEVPALREALKTVVRLHQKYRFGCAEIDPTEREDLRKAVQLCLAAL